MAVGLLLTLVRLGNNVDDEHQLLSDESSLNIAAFDDGGTIRKLYC